MCQPRPFLQSILLFATLITAQGCAYRVYPSDLTLVSVQKVNRATETQVPGWWVNDVLVRPNHPALKVTFTSQSNLWDSALAGEGINNGTWFCNREDRLPDFVGQPAMQPGWRQVFAGGDNLTDLSERSVDGESVVAPVLAAGADGRYRYHA